MNCKILAGPVTGLDGKNHNTGETIELSDSDAQQLATWGVVEPVNDKPATTVPESTAPTDSAPPTVETTAPPPPPKDVEVPKTEAPATDSGSTAKTETKTSK